MLKPPRWLLSLFCIVVALVVFWWFILRFFNQPSVSRQAARLSPRAELYLKPLAPTSTTEQAITECFSVSLPVPVINLKVATEQRDGARNCSTTGTIEQPRIQFTISANMFPTRSKLSDDPGVQMRSLDSSYTPQSWTLLSEYENTAFTSGTEVTTFWLDGDVEYVVSFHDLARVTEQVTALHTQFIEAVLEAKQQR